MTRAAVLCCALQVVANSARVASVEQDVDARMRFDKRLGACVSAFSVFLLLLAVVLLALLASGCAGPAWGGAVAEWRVFVRHELLRADSAFKATVPFRPVTDLRLGEAPAATAAVTLVWHMPTLKANGDPLGTAPLDWQAGYSRRSPTYAAHEFWIRNYPDTATKYWPTVRAECEPLVVASGTATPGSIVAWPALDVPAGWWPYSWWIRTRQRPNGNWSRWSNPVSRADNQ